MSDRGWKVTPAVASEVPEGQRVNPNTPQTGGKGRLIGRVIIEEFESSDPQDEPVYYHISFPEGKDATEVRNYGRGLVKKLAARFDRT